MNTATRFKLFLMMVLEFFVWGAWLPLIFGYLPSLGFSASEPPQLLAPLFPDALPWLKVLFSEQSLILNAFPVSAIVGMFFSNQYADRHFAAEKFLAFSHLVGGLAMLGLGFTRQFWPFFGLMLVHCLLYVPTISITNSIAFAQMKDAQKEFGIIRMGGTIGWILAAWPFVFILVDWAKVPSTTFLSLYVCASALIVLGLLGYFVGQVMILVAAFRVRIVWGVVCLFVPFAQLLFIVVHWTKAKRGFLISLASLVLAVAVVFLWPSAFPMFAAWLGAALANPLTGEAAKAGARSTYIVAGIASLALAAFSLILPHTPPKKASEGTVEKLAWLEAGKLLRHPFVLVLWLVTFIDAFVHNCYFNWTGTFLGSSTVGIAGNWIMPVMSIGQIAEILTMLILGVTLKALGWRMTMVLGILGHAARFAVYAFFPQHKEMIILVQILHGICYAFFFATVYIFVDEYFPKDARASAQGLFNVMILGIGALAANSVCPYLIQKVFTANNVTDFRGLFLVPMSFALFAACLLFACFRPPQKSEAAVEAPPRPAH